MPGRTPIAHNTIAHNTIASRLLGFPGSEPVIRLGRNGPRAERFTAGRRIRACRIGRCLDQINGIGAR